MDRSGWVAIDASTDPRAWARTLARARSKVIEGLPKPEVVRDAIASSWSRSADAGVDPEGAGPRLGISIEEAAERWRQHPLSIAEPILSDLLRDVHSDDDQVVLICDADGTLLWIDGEPAVLDAAQEIHLQPGALWGESEAGTNAMGTALAMRHPIQVFSAEHFSSGVHEWTCSAAPIRDPETGRALGVIDLSGELGTAHPHSLALIEAAARVIEAKLEGQRAARQAQIRERDAERPRGARGRLLRKADARAVDRTMRVAMLGSDRARVIIGGDERELSPRHSEIIALLALIPGARDAERLARELYGEDGKAVSARSELSRLRQRLDGRLASGSPELIGEVSCDFGEVELLVEAGRLAEALDRYPGPLLPGSRVPEVIELRERLDHALREAAIRDGRADLLALWIATPSGANDLSACRALASKLDEADPRRPGALSRLRRIATA